VQTQVSERPGLRRVHAIINPASGGVGPGASDEMAAVFAEFGLDHDVSELAPGEVEARVRAVLDTGPDLVVVLGGDGTTRLVAEMCGPYGPMIAPLSGGTMNKLGKGLYGARPWRESLEAILTSGEEQWVPGGEAAGRAFYCSAVLGFPALGARARESFRSRRYDLAWRYLGSAFRRTFQSRLRFAFGGREIGRGVAIGLLCPTISRAISDEDALEAAVLNMRDARAAARLAYNHLFDDWRNDPDVTTRTISSGRVWARHSIPAMLDGEYFRFGKEVEIAYRARGFRALAPPPEAEPGP
jgi:diacylglycerol kinase family enzyme